MQTINDETVTVEVTMNASIETVWKAWTDPALILKWFGSDPKGTGLKAKLDVRPQGSFEVTFRDSDGTEHTCSGVYADVQMLKKLVFTWTWKSEPGVESVVTVILSPDKDRTRMLFTHAHLGTGSKHNYMAGWQSTFSKLDRMLTGK